jgi:hypothetical protein
MLGAGRSDAHGHRVHGRGSGTFQIPPVCGVLAPDLCTCHFTQQESADGIKIRTLSWDYPGSCRTQCHYGVLIRGREEVRERERLGNAAAALRREEGDVSLRAGTAGTQASLKGPVLPPRLSPNRTDSGLIGLTASAAGAPTGQGGGFPWRPSLSPHEAPVDQGY